MSLDRPGHSRKLRDLVNLLRNLDINPTAIGNSVWRLCVFWSQSTFSEADRQN
jgi:hypothetical protein